MKRTLFVFACIGIPSTVSAQIPPDPAPAPSALNDTAIAGTSQGAEARDARREVPIVAYTYSAAGTVAKTIGAQAYGMSLVAPNQDSVVGGGGAIWGSPFDGLTIVVDGQRNLSRDFSPSAAGIVRLYGNGREGLTLGGLGKFKIDGFGKGPGGDEVESEVEIGALVSFASNGWHLDLNAIGGAGLGDDGEVDTEGRFRIGYDLGSWVRLGLDNQARVRVSGPLTLANGRTWDFAAGAQLLACAGNFFGSFTAGPTTMGLVSKNVGATALVTVGATTF
jgi:hypothetical protein